MVVGSRNVRRWVSRSGEAITKKREKIKRNDKFETKREAKKHTGALALINTNIKLSKTNAMA